MAQIGLKNVHYATRTVSESQGVKSVVFGTPAKLAPAISANIEIEYAEGELPADDIMLYSKKIFKSGTLTLNTAELPDSFATAILGARAATDGMIVDAAEDAPVECAIGFESAKANGGTRYVWLLRVLFSLPSDEFETKGDSITFKTPTIEGKIMEEVVEDAGKRHQWRRRIDSDASGTGTATTIDGWFNAVPTPSFTT